MTANLESLAITKEAGIQTRDAMDILRDRGLFETIPAGVRGVRAMTTTRELTATEPVEVALDLSGDGSIQVKDEIGNPGVVLTGKWIQDYGRMILLVPEYEKTIAGYRKQAELNQQLIAEFEGAIEIKDQKNSLLSEIADTERARGDRWKALAEISGDSWWEAILRKLAFPAGITVGLIIGSNISD